MNQAVIKGTQGDGSSVSPNHFQLVYTELLQTIFHL